MKHIFRNTSLSAALMLALLLVLTLLTGCASMDGFLFNSKPLSSYTLPTTVIPESAREFVTLNSGGKKIYGYFVKPATSRAPVTVLYSHGNSKNIEAYWDRMELFYKSGVQTFIYDYQGYGMSEGTGSEAALQSDAKAALDYVLSRPDVRGTKLVFYGYSLGGYPSIYLASQVRSPDVLVTEAAFASSEALVQSGTLLDVPGSFLMKGEFNNAENIKRVNCPFVLMHGTADRFIDINRHGERIFANANQPKKFLYIQGAGHSTIPDTMGFDVYISTIKDVMGVK
jgi:alpha-beta hydrolase superfamily lysophospholipase